MDLLVRRMYGGSSEKLDPRQGLLFDPHGDAADEVAVAEVPPAAEAAVEASSPAVAKAKKRRPRRPDQLAVIEVLHDLTDAEKRAVAGDGELTLIGEEITKQYEWQPSNRP